MTYPFPFLLSHILAKCVEESSLEHELMGECNFANREK